ncbi:unnamed protein product [Didymodactylos carnosus]|uniref:Uncharacterized protein n=1 Tax=Didymodactylos carnosus TaxID=1234261 RepID=A0A813NJ79_9BILA|nr:unnamed protein product [Didymodactylos carnosus]CAF0740597.1 unnamed protein product [Didymodactylos carnosus]CAF3517997.1 unnamed protein product [Didymodactylos carnosus]CAF3518757.1 unnamed protein product [Didymodactylos carnosus]
MKEVGNGYVCPNDRQLQLRAKLNSGWSFHTSRTNTNRTIPTALRLNNQQTFKDEELERIKKVIERAQRIDMIEQERVGKLIDRLDNMKKHAAGNGSTQCVLCADSFGMLGASSVACTDCYKSVCNKCSIETVNPVNQQIVSLCKICSENRELWKKSGAWFFRSLPRYVLPSNVKQSLPVVTNFTKSGHNSSDDDSSSDEHQHRPSGDKFNHRQSPSSPFPAITTNPFQQQFQQNQQLENSSSMPTTNENSMDSFKLDGERSNTKLSIDDYLPKSQTKSASVSVNVNNNNNIVRKSSIMNTSPSSEDCGFGSLEFELLYKDSLNILTIRLIRAKHLRSCDSNGLSDPYVKIHLVPGVAKATKLRSNTIRRTLNPEFDETLVYHGVTVDDMKTKALKLTVLDEDSIGADFIGEYRLKLSSIKSDIKESFSIYLHNKTDVRYPLNEQTSKELNKVFSKKLPGDEDKTERGKLLVGLLYSKSTNDFHVKCIRGSQLLPMDFGKSSDPYIKLSLYPLPADSKSGDKWRFKTSCIKKTLHPEFNEEFVFHQIQLKDLISKTLQITVYDKDVGKKDDYIGGFELGHNGSGDELAHWLTMVKSPNQWTEMKFRVMRIKSLAAQTALRESTFAQLDANQQAQDEQLRLLNVDLQFKLSKTDGIVQKLQADVENISHGLRDIQNTQQELNRMNAQRYQELKNELTTLSQRLDRMFNEQQVVLRSFETDTARALSTADSRSRAFVDELRSQFFQTKSQDDSERERNEQRMHQKLDEIKRTLEKYDRLEKRIDDVVHQFERKTATLEDQYKRTVSDLNRSNETVEQTVYRRFDEKYQRTSTNLEKVKKEMRTCFESLEGSVKTLQRITDGRIKVAEEKFDKEIDKVRKMVVLI